jgi:hypothetical protein
LVFEGVLIQIGTPKGEKSLFWDERGQLKTKQFRFCILERLGVSVSPGLLWAETRAEAKQFRFTG